MSQKEKSFEVIRRELKTVTICDGCGAEAKAPEPGMVVPSDWYRLGHGLRVVDACSMTCASALLEKFALVGVVR